MQVKIRATKAYTYAGRQRQIGDVFEAIPRDARTLIAIKKAEAYVEPVEAPAEAKKLKYKTRDMKAED